LPARLGGLGSHRAAVGGALILAVVAAMPPPAVIGGIECCADYVGQSL
jgi:hypothetical protein